MEISTSISSKLFFHEYGFFIVNGSFVISPILSYQEDYERVLINILSFTEEIVGQYDFISSQLFNYISKTHPDLYLINHPQFRIQITLDINFNGQLPFQNKLENSISSVLKSLLLFNLEYKENFVCLKA
jgi:hypothetical protein